MKFRSAPLQFGKMILFTVWFHLGASFLSWQRPPQRPRLKPSGYKTTPRKRDWMQPASSGRCFVAPAVYGGAGLASIHPSR